MIAFFTILSNWLGWDVEVTEDEKREPRKWMDQRLGLSA